MSNLIGLGGYAYAGKDAFADVLEKRNWYKTYMSKYLRQSLEILDPVVGVDDYGNPVRFAETIRTHTYEGAKEIPEVRRLLQMLGTDVGRELYGKDFWLDLCFSEVVRELRHEHDVVVTGIRYHNELKRIEALGGKSVWVSRPGRAPVNSHSSDNTLGMDDFDYIFDNNGTLLDLDRAVPAFVKSVMDIPVIDPKETVVSPEKNELSEGNGDGKL